MRIPPVAFANLPPISLSMFDQVEGFQVSPEVPEFTTGNSVTLG